MSEDLLKSFQEAYRNLELLPLVESNDLDRFRVDYGNEVIEELEQLVEDSPNADSKIIFPIVVETLERRGLINGN